MPKKKTAKTGDKALYKARDAQLSSKKRKDEKDDSMYNEIDQFHNRRQAEEFINLNDAGDSSEEDDGITRQENILDLGVDNASSDEEDEDDSSSDEDEKVASKAKANQALTDESSEEELSSDSEEEVDMDLGDIRDWGRKKSAYYHGDTADLEIGQDEQDALDEEEAAKEVEASRYEQMDEDDFVLSDSEQDAPSKSTKKSASRDAEQLESSRDLSKLTRADKRKLLQSHHPELLPLLSHFSEVVKDWDGRTSVVAKALLDSKEDGTPEAVGATPAGLQYLVSKSLLQTSTALNLAMYLLLKSEQVVTDKNADEFLGDMRDDTGPSIQSHPVMTRLQQLNALAQKLEAKVENKVEGLSNQIDNLVKAASLMQGEQDESDESDSDDDSDAEKEVPGQSTSSDEEEQASDAPPHLLASDQEDEDEIARSVLTEARFGLRQHEVGESSQKKRRRRAAPSVFGDEEVEESQTRKATQKLASTINAIEQRSETRKRKTAKLTESLDDTQENDDAVRRGLEMMEEALGKDSDDGGEGVDNELGSDEGGDDFYAQIKRKSKAKKEFKKSLYQVAPKYPKMEDEVQGERAISKQILKNRGLVAHKAKINRNPRVKKREQYRKAIIRRKGKVRDVRTDEGHRYGGEATGIKSSLSRSRKL